MGTEQKQFVVNGSAWLLPDELAAKIVRFMDEQKKPYQKKRPYLLEFEKPDVIIYANFEGGEWKLTLGVSEEDDTIPDAPTWGEWLEDQGIDANDPEAVLEHAINYGLYDPDSRQAFVPPKPGDEIPDKLVESLRRTT